MAAYPAAPEGTRSRWLDFPCDAPEPAPAAMAATRRDGSACDVLRSLGLRTAGPASRADHVRWEPVS